MLYDRYFPSFKYFKDKTTIMDVDFSQPWWKIFSNQKPFVFAWLIGELVSSIFRPLSIFFISLVFSSMRMDYFVCFFVSWFFVYVITFITRLYKSVFQLRAIHSLHYQAHSWFLKVDPIFHSNRSSGTILGKIDRATKALENLVNAIGDHIVYNAISSIVVIITLLCYSITLGISAFILLSSIVFLIILIAIYFNIPYEKKLIKADDKSKSISVENLAQIVLIRTCFASPQMDDRLHEKDSLVARTEGKLWFFYNFSYTFVKSLYLLSMVALGIYVFNAISNGIINHTIGVTLFFTYMRGTYDIIRLEQPIRDTFNGITRIKDLFKYINEFGTQTYPVLKSKKESKATDYNLNIESIKNNKSISVSMDNLFFDYNPNAKIFDGHNLDLKVLTKQSNKLYGVIGPSGIGKSTFISLLGGQLNPSSGLVKVNDVNVYKIDDYFRRDVIALQGQGSGQIRGTLRHNLLFGLPRELLKDKSQEQEYNHVKLLERVSLWTIFEKKSGLNTFIGEGGLNLSGGQRQRLNFANLYLRATYFKPLLILIDEPTSSLDEVSEQSVTEMIFELARSSLTIVIAHRIKTINDAVGIMDFSLLYEEKNLVFHSHHDLKTKSKYYQRLLSGKESIES
jgi:ABC-type multidrug transport system fused ATPase/permease subunit